jgi:hypothetical protein
MDLRPVSLQVLGPEDACGGAGQQLSEDMLTLGKPRAAQVESVEIEQVERVVEQPVLAARGQIGVQQSEIRDAPRIDDDGFSIQDQVVRREFRECIRNRAEALCPVVAPPCVDGRPSVSQVRLRAVAVELDLVQPALA